VEGRGAFYDRVGALRDVVQNHLLQVLALVAMEPPSGDDESVSRHRLDVFRSMPSVDPAHAVRGQYQSYGKVEGVEAGSDTETFVGLKLTIENWRWSGVPIFVRAGKYMPVSATEIIVRLKQVPELRYGTHRLASPGYDDVVFRIGRDAGMTITLFAKTPGAEDSREVTLDVSFLEELGKGPGPYERLLTDALNGRTMLFPRWDVIEETWRIVQPLLDDPPPVEKYRRGTWGPRRASALARRHGGWREPQ
jgi:glucose-6-phosphate 1-dehydrogenase